MVACERGYQKVAAMLLGRKDLNINAQRKSDGSTALHAVVEKGSMKTLQLLVSKKLLNPNLQHKTLDTALHVACTKGDAEIVSILLIHPKMKKVCRPLLE